MQCELKICRICLRTECKLYKFDRFQLKSYYEQIMALEIKERDVLPQYFCFECATMLHKFHKFIDKCYIGLKSFKEIIWRGPITYEAVHNVARIQNNLKSPIGILTVTSRVKTYCTKYTFDITESESEEEEIEVTDGINTKARVIEEQYVGENSMTDTDADFDPDYDPIHENIKDDSFEVDNYILPDIAKEDEKLEEKIEENKPSTHSSTVFVNVKNIMLNSEKIKQKEKSLSENGLKKIKPVFTKRNRKPLDLTYWKKSILSEEEAVKSFRERSKNPKYLAAAYKCADCLKVFSKEDIFKRHKQLWHTETVGALECRFCHMRFNSDLHLRKHMPLHFNIYECQRCDLVCNAEQQAKMHDDYHNGVKKKCMQCGEEFKHSTTYYSHLRTTHRSQHICTSCGVSFVSARGLQKHKKIKHISNEIIEKSHKDGEVNTFCAKCDIRFETRKAYEEHLLHSAMHTEEEDEETNGGTKLKEDTDFYKIKKPDEMNRDGTLQNRKGKSMPKKMSRKPTKCEQCGKDFSTQLACMEHHRAEHPHTTFYIEKRICEICGASLSLANMATHLNSHTREQQFCCDTCGRAFSYKTALLRHLVTHTGEKPFACTLCDKRYTQSSSLTLHVNTAHLKQPYPKRNRWIKKVDVPPEFTEYNKSTNQTSGTRSRSQVSRQD